MSAFEHADLGRPAALQLFAEQLRVHPLRRHAGGADGDEFVASARARTVDQPGHRLLARARGAGDQHPAVGRGELAYQATQLLGDDRLADQAVRLDGLGPKSAVLALQVAGLQRSLDAEQQPVRLEGLFEELVGAALDRTYSGFDVAVTRDHDHRNVGVEFLDKVKQFQTVHPATLHPDVEDQQSRLARLYGRQCAFGVVRGAHRIAFVRQDAGHQLANVRLVVDHKNVGRHHITPAS